MCPQAVSDPSAKPEATKAEGVSAAASASGSNSGSSSGSGSDSGSESDSSSEDELHKPITDAREITFSLLDINPYISCTLCKGYLRDAHTISACFHTFCRSCLLQHIDTCRLKDREFVPCPYEDPKTAAAQDESSLDPALQNNRRSGIKRKRPNTHSNSNAASSNDTQQRQQQCPTMLITGEPLKTECKFDRALQSLVDKLLPQFVAQEEQLKRDLAQQYAPKPESAASDGDALVVNGNTTAATTSTSATTVDARKQRTLSHLAQQIVYELQPAKLSAQESRIPGHAQLPALTRPFVRSSAKLTIRYLVKYVTQQLLAGEHKLALPAHSEIAFHCSGELLGSDHSLEFVQKTRWMHKQQHLLLTYKQVSSL